MKHNVTHDEKEVSPGDLALTPEQYNLIMDEIWKNHRFGMYPSPDNCKCIKYVRPNWDLRDGLCFSIKFDGLGLSKEGITYGSGYGETTPMYERIMEWLNKSNK